MKEERIKFGDKIKNWIEEEKRQYKEDERVEYIKMKEQKRAELEEDLKVLEKTPKIKAIDKNRIKFQIERFNSEISLYKREQKNFLEIEKYIEGKGIYGWDYPSRLSEIVDSLDKNHFDGFFNAQIGLYSEIFSKDELAWIEMGLLKYFAWSAEFNMNSTQKYSRNTNEFYRVGEAKRTTDSISLGKEDRKFEYARMSFQGRQKTMAETLYFNIMIDRMEMIKNFNHMKNTLEMGPNNVHMTKFRDGNQHVGNHSEVGKELKEKSFRMFLFFGEKREMMFNKYKNDELKKIKSWKDHPIGTRGIHVSSGDLIIMHPGTENYFTHSFSRVPEIKKSSFFLIFRTLNEECEIDPKESSVNIENENGRKRKDRN